MSPLVIQRIGVVLMGGALGLLVGAGLVLWINPTENGPISPLSQEASLPKTSYECPAEAYTAINGPLLQLEKAAPTLQLPDLRQQILFCGKNGRPDVDPTKPSYHFLIAQGKNLVSCATGDPIYLVYEKIGRAHV